VCGNKNAYLRYVSLDVMYVFAPYGINIMIISVDVVFVLVFPGYVVV
jgi:uncharacterized membrane protein